MTGANRPDNPNSEIEMLQFLADLFAAPTTTRAVRKSPLGLTALEDRLTPAVNVDAVMFNPQPDPPVQTRTIIIEGGHTATPQTRTIIIEGGHTATPRGIIAI